MKRALFVLAVILFSSPAFAGLQNSFIYNKAVLKIVPKAEAPQPEPAEKPDKKDGVTDLSQDSLLPKLNRAPKEFTVDVRSPSFLTQSDFIALQPFDDREGMLILLDPPAVASVPPTRMLSSADVLFVDADGYIIRIAPELKISKLAETVDSGRPVRAVVYLKSGTAAGSDIQLGDRIEGDYFKTHPTVLQ